MAQTSSAFMMDISHASAITISSTLDNGISSNNKYDYFGNGGNQRGGIDIDLLRQSLVTPTPDKPQITLSENYFPTIVDHNENTSNNNNGYDTKSTAIPSSIITTKSTSSSSSSSSSSSKTKIPIAEGLIYLQNNNNNNNNNIYNERPNLNDNIIVTISSTSDPTNIIAGAKYPVYKAKFPFNFKMYNENILKGKEQIWQQLEKGNEESRNNSMNRSNNGSDLLITARICPEEILTLPCKDEESTYFAKGVSKILMIGNLPGATEGQSLRTPVSLPLMKKQ